MAKVLPLSQSTDGPLGYGRRIIKPSMSPKSEPCAVRTRLIAELTAVHREIVALGDQEVGAVMRGDLETVKGLEPHHTAARARRDAAMAAIRDHITEHGC